MYFLFLSFIYYHQKEEEKSLLFLQKALLKDPDILLEEGRFLPPLWLRRWEEYQQKMESSKKAARYFAKDFQKEIPLLEKLSIEEKKALQKEVEALLSFFQKEEKYHEEISPRLEQILLALFQNAQKEENLEERYFYQELIQEYFPSLWKEISSS